MKTTIKRYEDLNNKIELVEVRTQTTQYATNKEDYHYEIVINGIVEIEEFDYELATLEFEDKIEELN